MIDYEKLSVKEKEWVGEINDLFYRNWRSDRDRDRDTDIRKGFLDELKDMGEGFLETDLKAKRKDFLDRIGLIVRAVRKIEWVLESLESYERK